MSETTVAARDQRTGALFLHAQTSLHPGSGTALGVVDLPVQRERHTLWPLIPGSTLKGVLRDACREQVKDQHEDEFEQEDGEQKRQKTRRQVANEENELLTAVFGPGKIDESSSYAGALSVTDARILAFPVRSLCGVFAWITCPAVLERLSRDLALAGLQGPPIDGIQADTGRAFCPKGSPLLVDGKSLVLEEFDFSLAGDCAGLAQWLASHAVKDPFTTQRFQQHLAVLADDDFTHFVRHATEVTARIGLDYNTKTVKTGALFYQEFLPPETLFYSLVLAGESRRRTTPMTPDEVMRRLSDWVGKTGLLQIGGDETIGKGICAVRLADGDQLAGGGQ